jgi:hypothetical protein
MKQRRKKGEDREIDQNPCNITSQALITNFLFEHLIKAISFCCVDYRLSLQEEDISGVNPEITVRVRYLMRMT